VASISPMPLVFGISPMPLVACPGLENTGCRYKSMHAGDQQTPIVWSFKVLRKLTLFIISPIDVYRFLYAHDLMQ
jgi:hypothetical protein